MSDCVRCTCAGAPDTSDRPRARHRSGRGAADAAKPTADPSWCLGQHRRRYGGSLGARPLPRGRAVLHPGGHIGNAVVPPTRSLHPASCILHRPSRRHLRWLLLLTPTPATRLQVLRRLKAAAREWERRLCCGLMTIGSLRLFAKLVQMARQRAVGDDEPGEVGGAMQTAMERERKQKKKEE